MHIPITFLKWGEYTADLSSPIILLLSIKLIVSDIFWPITTLPWFDSRHAFLSFKALTTKFANFFGATKKLQKKLV